VREGPVWAQKLYDENYICEVSYDQISQVQATWNIPLILMSTTPTEHVQILDDETVESRWIRDQIKSIAFDFEDSEQLLLCTFLEQQLCVDAKYGGERARP